MPLYRIIFYLSNLENYACVATTLEFCAFAPVCVGGMSEIINRLLCSGGIVILPNFANIGHLFQSKDGKTNHKQEAI